MKQSGVGREGGGEALRFFTEAKNVCIAKEAIEARKRGRRSGRNGKAVDVQKLGELYRDAQQGARHSASAEYRCSKAEPLRAVTGYFGTWCRDERMPRIEDDF
jgi:hypothetical protein